MFRDHAYKAHFEKNERRRGRAPERVGRREEMREEGRREGGREESSMLGGG